MRRLLSGLLVLCSVVVVLTIIEGGLRLLVEGQVGAGEAKEDDEPDRGEKWIRREQRTGWVPLEGANVERQSPDGAPFRMRVNSTGQRGAELGKATPDERRLVASRYARIRAEWTGDLAVLDLDHRYYYYAIGFYQGRDDGYFATARDLTLATIEQIRRLVVADGAELALVVLPSQNQVDRREWLRMLQKLGVDEADLGPIDMEYPNKILGEFCTQQRIPYLDLYRHFATADNVEDLYLTAIGDGHLSGKGHALVAKEVGSFLKDGPLKYRSPVVGLYKTGLHAAESGDLALAESSLVEAYALRPDWSAPADALADVYVQQRRWDEAQAFYRQALDSAPDRKETWAKLGALLDTMGGQGAEAAWRRALELHPEWWPYYTGLLAHYEGLGQADKAARMREQIALLHKAPLPIKRFWWNEHISQGTVAGAAERWVESEKEFKRAIGFLPGEPVAFYNIGRVYQQTNRGQLARAAYEKALAVDASFRPARQQLKTLQP